MLELDAKPLNQSPLGALYTQEEWLVVFLSFLRRENDAGKKCPSGLYFLWSSVNNVVLIFSLLSKVMNSCSPSVLLNLLSSLLATFVYSKLGF